MLSTFAALILAVAPSGEGPPPKPMLTLSMAKQRFVLADRDESGALDKKEAKRLGLGTYSLRFFDADSSGTLSLAEAYVAQREVASAEGRKVCVKLAAKVTRILAERRAREARRRRDEKGVTERQVAESGPSRQRLRARRENDE